MKYRKILLLSFITFLILISCTYSIYAENFEISTNLLTKNNTYSLIDLYNYNFKNPINIDDGNIYDFYYNKLIVNRKGKNLLIGYFTETQTIYHLNQDTIKLFSEDYNINEKYNISISGLTQKIKGIILGHKLICTDKIQGILYGKLITGTILKQRNYRLKVNQSKENYSLSGFKDGVNSKIGEKSELTNKKFHSQGYSFDLSFLYNINNYSLSYTGKNILSNIYWYNIYTQAADFNSDNTITNKNGLKEYVSSTTGNFCYNDYKTSLISKHEIQFDTPQFDIGINYYNEIYPYFNYKISQNPTVKIGFYKNLLSFNLKTNYIDISFKTDNINLNKSSAISCGINLNYNF